MDSMEKESLKVAKQVLKNHDILFAQRPPNVAAEIMTSNFTDIAYAPYGEYWRQMRKICVLEFLSAKRVQKMYEIRKNEVSRLVNVISLNTGSETNLSEMLSSLTYTITSISAFGGATSNEKYVPILKEMVELGSGLTLVDLFPSIKLLRLMSGTRSKMEKLHKESGKLLDKIIDEHRKNRGKMDSSDDLVDAFLDHQENGDLGFHLTSDNIKAVMQDIILGGSDTSSTAMVWAMSELLKDPESMKKAQKEVREALLRSIMEIQEINSLQSKQLFILN